MNLNVDKAVLIKSDVMVAVYLMGRLADTKIILTYCVIYGNAYLVKNNQTTKYQPYVYSILQCYS